MGGPLLLGSPLGLQEEWATGKWKLDLFSFVALSVVGTDRALPPLTPLSPGLTGLGKVTDPTRQGFSLGSARRAASSASGWKYTYL